MTPGTKAALLVLAVFAIAFLIAGYFTSEQLPMVGDVTADNELEKLNGGVR